VDVELEPNEAYVRVPDAAQVTLAAPYEFLGVNAGESFWELPSGSPGGLPFVGLATEELPGDVFTGLATLSLSNFQGPGEFALYQFSGPTPDVFWRTNDGVDSTVDTLELPIGSHDHFNWGFTEPGVYQLTLTGTADLTGGGSQTAMGTFSFAVGDVTAIPEPSAVAALLAVSAGGMAVTIRRRRRARKAHEG
jgi:surface-anchored protein